MKQAGAGVVPSSGLARSWSRVKVRKILIGAQNVVEIIPFLV